MVFGRSYHLIEYSDYLTIGLNPNANLKDVLWKSNGLRRFFLKFFFDASARGVFWGPRGAFGVVVGVTLAVFVFTQMPVLKISRRCSQIGQIFLILWMGITCVWRCIVGRDVAYHVLIMRR